MSDSVVIKHYPGVGDEIEEAPEVARFTTHLPLTDGLEIRLAGNSGVILESASRTVAYRFRPETEFEHLNGYRTGDKIRDSLEEGRPFASEPPPAEKI